MLATAFLAWFRSCRCFCAFSNIPTAAATGIARSSLLSSSLADRRGGTVRHDRCSARPAQYNSAPPTPSKTAQAAVLGKFSIAFGLCGHYRGESKSRMEMQWPLSGVHSIIMVNSVQPGEGGRVHRNQYPPPVVLKSIENKKSMTKTQVCTWIAFCRKTKIEPRNLKSERSLFPENSTKLYFHEFHLNTFWFKCASALYSAVHTIFIFVSYT